MSQAKWARVEPSVNLDASGTPDPHSVSIDLATARHPQTLLATHFNGQPLNAGSNPAGDAILPKVALRLTPPSSLAGSEQPDCQ
jgi:hypothetical protein